VIEQVNMATATATKIIAIGNSAGIIVPREMLSRLHVERGDTVYLSEGPGGLQITPYDAEFSAKMEAADRAIRRYRDALKKLAE
jgi:putative addiction module antidote